MDGGNGRGRLAMPEMRRRTSSEEEEIALAMTARAGAQPWSHGHPSSPAARNEAMGLSLETLATVGAHPELLPFLAPRPLPSMPPPGSPSSDSPLRIPPLGMPMPSMANILLTEIRTPHPNDVLCGRGGGTNNHAGNEKFRDLVNSQKVLYLHSSKRDKPFVSRGIVRAVRAQNPPGRFLQKDEQTGMWYDIGDQKAREKTSQALREGAPEIRREITTVDSRGQSTTILLPPGGQQRSPLGSGPPGMGSYMPSPSGTGIDSFDHIAIERRMHNAAMAEAAMRESAASRREVASPDYSNSTDLNRGVSSGSGNSAGLSAKDTDRPDRSQAQSRKEAISQIQRARAAAVVAHGSSMPFGSPGLASLRRTPAGYMDGPTRSQLLGLAANEARVAAVRQIAGPYGGFRPRGHPGVPLSVGIGRGSGRGVTPFHSELGGLKHLPSAENSMPPRMNTENAIVPAMNGSGFGRGFDRDRLNSSIPNQLPTVHAQVANSGNAVRPGKVGARRKEMLSLLNDGLSQRLVLAETIAQRTVNGTISEELKAEEKRMSLYLDAGLLGIDLNYMSDQLSTGRTEADIVEQRYKTLLTDAQRFHDDDDDDEGTGDHSGKKRKRSARPSSLPSPKKMMLDGIGSLEGHSVLTERNIRDALVAIGAVGESTMVGKA